MNPETNFGWTTDALKAMLQDLQPCKTDFTIEMTSKSWAMLPGGGYVLGNYNEGTHLICILANRCRTAKEVLEVVIHEYVHHLMWEAFHFGEFKRRVVHGKPFWDCYFKLIRIANIKGVFNVENTGEDQRFKEITEAWFITEPTLIMALMTHQLTTNSRIRSFRCGKGLIEYNPQYTRFLSKPQLEERLKAEVIRILLRHPYRTYAERGTAFVASNITLNEHYPFKELMYKATDFWPTDRHYRNENLEFYYRELKKIKFPTDPDGEFDHQGGDEQQSSENSQNRGQSDNNQQSEITESAALWEEDDFMDQKLKDVIEWAKTGMSWGTIPGDLVQTLIASLKPEVDYRKILSAFRSSVISSNKMLTRFKPSRRYGFEYMGKKNDFTTSLLIAVDVSGSVSDKEVRMFYSVINRFFKYGIKTIDVLQFDYDLKLPILSMKKAEKTIKLLGRGGTDFQPVIDYFEKSKKKYDGLIFFTDGYAESPQMLKHTIRKTLWICNDKESYEHHKEWMEKCGKSCWIKEN